MLPVKVFLLSYPRLLLAIFSPLSCLHRRTQLGTAVHLPLTYLQYQARLIDHSYNNLQAPHPNAKPWHQHKYQHQHGKLADGISRID
jgi:endonuclease/exonuclease/phosphatase (EEP) superfamily protein YafD